MPTSQSVKFANSLFGYPVCSFGYVCWFCWFLIRRHHLMFRAAPCRASIAARERTHARQRLIVANNSRIFLRHVQGSCSRDALVRRDQPRLPHIFRSPPPLSPIESFASTPPSFRASLAPHLASAPGSGATLKSRVTQTVGRDFEPDRKRIHRRARPRQLPTWNKISPNDRLSSLTQK